MSQNKSNIFFNIISEYRDKGAKQAEKSFLSLEGAAGKLAKTVASAFAVGKIVQFGKSSVEAFMAEQRATVQLENSFKNLGLQIQTITAQKTIKDFMKLYGVQDELLIPAMTKLVAVTKNAATATDILQTALDVSAGTGKDLDSVTAALAKAYGGNTAALVRLGAGLTQADLKGKTFLQIQQQLNNLWKGAAASAADSYAGKLTRIKVGIDEMKQSIGEGLVNAFVGLAGGGGSIDQAISKLNQFGLMWQSVFSNIGTAGSSSNSPLAVFFDVAVLQPLDRLASKINFLVTGKLQSGADLARQAYGEKLKTNTKALEGYYKNISSQNAINAKFVAQDLANQKAITDQKAKQLALEKAKAVLNVSAKLLDVQQAEIVAAMMNTTLNQNELDRLNLKKALMDDNATAAGKYAQELINSQIASLKLAQANPFGLMNTDIMAAVSSLQALAKALSDLQIPLQNTSFQSLVNAGLAYQSSTGQIASASNPMNGWFGYLSGATAGLYGAQAAQGQTITIVDATTGGVNAITQNNSLNGTPASVTRYNPILDR